MAEYIEREKLAEALKIWQNTLIEAYGEDDDYVRCLNSVLLGVDNAPAADVPPALWTDEPISGTEFMTHNQGQRGFEIHFRTDDKAKYEAVQEECRRQMGHAKNAADVRPVVRGKWNAVKGALHPAETSAVCSNCGFATMIYAQTFYNFCPNCGADMREGE